MKILLSSCFLSPPLIGVETLIFLEKSLKLLAEKSESLKKATLKDKKRTSKTQTLAWQLDTENPDAMDFSGIEYSKQTDAILGLEYIKWLHRSYR